jgi:NAD(P)-dependent dehydrogenase (short-subunit alcohol dehydrogenase family)
MSERKRVMLITGAAGGVGKATLKVFADAGWRVIGVDRRPFDAEFPEDGLFIQADIAVPEEVEAAFEEVKAYTPVLDAVINNAAMQVCKPILETSIEEWDTVMAANLRAVFLWAKYTHPLMMADGGGAFVNVSSVHAVATSSGVASYAASKGGILAMTRSMAIEFADDNIRTNAILPGAVNTPMLTDHLNKERLENLARRTVNGRVGEPEEIAHAIYFLADNKQSSFMTGQAIIVDGGATCLLSTEGE